MSSVDRHESSMGTPCSLTNHPKRPARRPRVRAPSLPARFYGSDGPAGTMTLPVSLRSFAGWRDCTRDPMPHGALQLPSGMRAPIALRAEDALHVAHVVLIKQACVDNCSHDHAEVLRAQNSIAEELQELPKCCQQALDLDEPIAAVKAMIDRSQEVPRGAHAGHDHGNWVSRPHGAWEWTGASIIGYVAGFGIYFGAQNLQNSQSVLRQLKTGSDRVTGRINEITGRPASDAAQPDIQVRKIDLQRLNRSRRTAVRNLVAQDNGLRAGQSMQRFIYTFAGALPIASSALMLCGVAVQPLALVSTALLALYCFSHTIRYILWDRVRPKQELPPTTCHEDPQVAAGRRVFAQVQEQRRSIFRLVASCFATYGLGAAAFVAAGLFPALAPVVLVPSMVLLGIGMGTVTYLNNFSIRKAFINNQNATIDREHLGSKASILRQIAAHDCECAALRKWRKDEAPKESLLPWLCEAPLITLSYLTTFGITMRFINPLRHRRRVSDYSSGAVNALGSFIEASGHIKVEHLTHELREATLRKDAATTAADRLPFEGTQDLLLGWLAAERQVLNSMSEAKDLADTAACIWHHLAMRDLLDDMTVALTNRLDPKADWGPWWAPNGGTVVLSRDVWRRALAAGDIEAERQLQVFCGEAAHLLKHLYETTLEGRKGSLVDQLTGRLQEKALRQQHR